VRQVGHLPRIIVYRVSGQLIDEKVVHLNGSFNFPDLSDPFMTQTHGQSDSEIHQATNAFLLLLFLKFAKFRASVAV
jgi:hypothetical protein